MSRTKRRNELMKALRTLVPLASLEDFNAIFDVASQGHLRHLPPSIAAWQAVTTVARHRHTEYETLLADGYDAEAARHFVADDIDDALEAWGCPRRLER